MAIPIGKTAPVQNYPNLDLASAATSEDPLQEKEGGWLISFVDILTLVLTLMVLLLAFNQLSQRDHDRHAASPPTTASVTPSPKKPLPQPVAAAEPTKQFIIPQDIRDKIDVVTTANEVDLVIKDDVLFDEGSPALKATGTAMLDRLARLLNENDYPVSVEGHTDNIPIHTAQFPSNWELSTFRATTVTRYFITHGIAVDRLRATGYADTRPIADNATAPGRARNRRVSLVVHVNETANAQQAGLPRSDTVPTNRDKS